MAHYFSFCPSPGWITTALLLYMSHVHDPAYRIFLISLGSERSCPFVESSCCRSVKIRDGVWTVIFPPFTQSVKHMFLFSCFSRPLAKIHKVSQCCYSQASAKKVLISLVFTIFSHRNLIQDHFTLDIT